VTLDSEALGLFARKGLEAGRDAPQVGLANGAKVRRVMQLTADLTGRPAGELRILDLGCGEGVYAIEAALRGARVVALDARTERMAEGMAVAGRHGLDTVEFRQEDVRHASRDRHGRFDVVWLLGLLYHLEAPDALALLRRVREMTETLIVDTLVATAARDEAEGYEGERVREHADDDPPDVRRARVLRSIDNAFAFRFTRASLVRALRDAGFTSVLECHAPPEPEKQADRLTLAALGGAPVRVATYPAINEPG
jgi:SAM-dependent methyltransferase